MSAVSRAELYLFLCCNEQEIGIEVYKDDNSVYYEVVDKTSMDTLIRSNQHISTQLKIISERMGKSVDELLEDIISFLEDN